MRTLETMAAGLALAALFLPLVVVLTAGVIIESVFNVINGKWKGG
jgi:hypothetical protein